MPLCGRRWSHCCGPIPSCGSGTPAAPRVRRHTRWRSCSGRRGWRPGCALYATDINEKVLERAQEGVFPLERMRQYTQNYINAKGRDDFSSYYTVDGTWARFHPSLTEQVVFAQHNLVSDGPFNEFHLVLCRNVMIYFSKPLKDRAHGLFYDSLHTFGVLGLGQKESIRFSPHEDRYTAPPVRHEALPKDRLMARELVVIGCSKGGARTLPLLLSGPAARLPRRGRRRPSTGGPSWRSVDWRRSWTRDLLSP